MALGTQWLASFVALVCVPLLPIDITADWKEMATEGATRIGWGYLRDKMLTLVATQMSYPLEEELYYWVQMLSNLLASIIVGITILVLVWFFAKIWNI